TTGEIRPPPAGALGGHPKSEPQPRARSRRRPLPTGRAPTFAIAKKPSSGGSLAGVLTRQSVRSPVDTNPRPRPEDPAAAERAASTDDHVTDPAEQTAEPLTPPFAEDGDDEPAAHTEGSDHSTAAPATY